MHVQMRWVQTYLYCAAPPALRLGSVLPIFGCFYCGLCWRYPYTLRSDWALLLCCGFGGWYPSYRFPPFIRLVDMVATITDAGWSQGPYLAVCWNTDIPLLTAGTPQQYICLDRFFTRRSHPATFPHTPSFRYPPYRQQATTCLPVRKRATRGRLRSSTHPNLDAHETGRARFRSRDSRRGEPPGAGSGDEPVDGAPYLHPDPPTKRVDTPIRAEKKTDQPPPDSGASRRQLSPAPGERHQLPPPALDRASPPPPGLSALDRAPPPELPGPGRPCRPLGLGICGGAGPAGARRRQPDDSTPTSV